MDAVAIVRSRAKRAKTGHAGTLDPLATGVLVLALGKKATRNLDRFMATDKRYVTTIDLSAFTATDDAEGERREVTVTSPPALEHIHETVGRFVGRIMQRPPVYSAIKVGGRRAYDLSRRGVDVEIRERPVLIHDIRVVGYDWPMLQIEVHCAKGTYIRSLARDLGEALGTGGYCQELRRTAVGPFTLAMARTVDELPDSITQDDLMNLEEALELLKPGAQTESG